MSTRKVHLTKQDETVIERGVQLRTDDPGQPIDNQLWINKNDKKIFLRTNGETVSLSENTQSRFETFILTKQNVSEKKITLQFKPLANSILLTPEGGPTQTEGLDFEVINNNQVSWSNLGLDGFLEENETVFIKYLT